jgi:stearoyl-CoA desaturase (delta-9 desaturase)
VTLYLHRSQAHKAIKFNFIVEHFMRFWLWLTTGMITKEWVAIHRKHHRFSDVEGDPHSPVIYGLKKVLLKGALLYHEASKDKNMVNTYGGSTANGVCIPNDWLEHKLYTPYSKFGVSILLLFNVTIFGWVGAVIWLIQMLWIPFWAAGVINGLGHYWGYRNGITKDNSRNISFIGIIIGGEELHNNHHLEPANPKLSRKWFEFDIGWFWLNLLSKLKLAEILTVEKRVR